MASIIFVTVIFLIVSTKANPLQKTSLELQDEMKKRALSRMDDIRYPEHMEGKQGIKDTSKRWPNRMIPYTIKFADYSLTERGLINEAIADFNRRLLGCFQLVPRTIQRDYVMVTAGTGCHSMLGKIGGKQNLSLDPDGCLDMDTIQHEFMHAVGFTHEHNRPDRDDYVDVLWDNIPEKWHDQYEKENADKYGYTGEYDYYSIMHYPWFAPDTDPELDAFDIKAEGIDKYKLSKGENGGMTKLDVLKVQELYGCSTRLPSIG